ncbi:Hypothetical protein KVN_LOCUS112 [uncultured virus]|nr:Hypothetical protein KVN_LOCUS112 [uncultured virus]
MKLSDIPTEIWVEIFKFNNNQRIKQVCRFFNKIYETNFYKIDSNLNYFFLLKIGIQKIPGNLLNNLLSTHNNQIEELIKEEANKYGCWTSNSIYQWKGCYNVYPNYYSRERTQNFNVIISDLESLNYKIHVKLKMGKFRIIKLLKNLIKNKIDNCCIRILIIIKDYFVYNNFLICLLKLCAFQNNLKIFNFLINLFKINITSIESEVLDYFIKNNNTKAVYQLSKNISMDFIIIKCIFLNNIYLFKYFLEISTNLIYINWLEFVFISINQKKYDIFDILMGQKKFLSISLEYQILDSNHLNKILSIDEPKNKIFINIYIKNCFDLIYKYDCNQILLKNLKKIKISTFLNCISNLIHKPDSEILNIKNKLNSKKVRHIKSNNIKYNNKHIKKGYR